MKKTLYSIIAAAAILSGCNHELIVQEGTGSLALDLDCKMDYTDVETKASKTDDEIINALSIDIVRPFDGWKVNYTPFSDIRGKVVELGSGAYILTASSPEKKDAAFDQPIFKGTKEFDIKTGEVTSIDLTCTIDNAMVTVKLSEKFVKELSDYTVTVTNGRGTLSWNKNAEVNDFEPAAEGGKTIYKGKKSGYFTIAPLTVTVNGHRAIDGSEAKTVYNINTVNPADNHVLNLDANVVGSLGGLTIEISSDVKKIDQAVVVPGFEEKPVPGDDPSGDDNTGDDTTGDDNTGGDDPVGPAPSDAPVLVWESNPTFADLELPMDMNAKVDVELTIEAPKGIAELIIYVKSKVLAPTIAALSSYEVTDGVAKMDMIYDEILYGELGETLPMKDKILNQTSVPFSLSALVPMINMYVADITPGDEHVFSLYVKDNAGNTLEQDVTIVSVAVE